MAFFTTVVTRSISLVAVAHFAIFGLVRPARLAVLVLALEICGIIETFVSRVASLVAERTTLVSVLRSIPWRVVSRAILP